TGDATQIARRSRLNGRATRFANTGILTYGWHRDFLMQPLPDGDTAALDPRRADRRPCRRLLPAELRDIAHASVPRQRAGGQLCVRVGLPVLRTEWPRPRLRSGETSALRTGRLCHQARIPVQGDRALAERLMPPIRARILHLRSNDWIAMH